MPGASLLDKGHEWTPFERELFNLFTLDYPHGLIFSKRLRVVQAMLETMDAEIAVIAAEKELRL